MAFRKAHADKTRDPRIIAHAVERVMRAGRLFTMPGVMIILAAGMVFKPT